MWAIQRLADSLYFPIALASPPPPNVDWVAEADRAMPFFSKGECDAYRKQFLEELDEDGNVVNAISASVHVHLPEAD